MSPLTPTDDFPPGHRFGSYVVRGCVGRGGMARLYEAEHVKLGKTVALKVMERTQIGNHQWRLRFLREGRAAAGVKHPNIVDVTDVGVEDGMPYLVMEFLDGLDLAEHLRRTGPLSEQHTADLMLPIVSGLGYAHDRQIVHRDIKPSNIFLARSPDGEIVPKLLDFGIAKFSPSAEEAAEDLHRTDTNQLLGTPLFMPPEALNGARDLTAKADQYSLGVVIFHCLAGRSPFNEQTPASLLMAIAAGRHEPLRKPCPQVSRAVERLVQRAMSLDPDNRFAHVRDIGRQLFPMASPRSQALWSGTFGGSARSQPGLGRRPRRTAWLVGAGVAAVAVGAALWAVRSRSGEASSPPGPRALEGEASATARPEQPLIEQRAQANLPPPPPRPMAGEREPTEPADSQPADSQRRAEPAVDRAAPRGSRASSRQGANRARGLAASSQRSRERTRDHSSSPREAPSAVPPRPSSAGSPSPQRGRARSSEADELRELFGTHPAVPAPSPNGSNGAPIPE